MGRFRCRTYKVEENPRFVSLEVCVPHDQRHIPTSQDQQSKTNPHENRIFGPQFQSEPTCAKTLNLKSTSTNMSSEDQTYNDYSTEGGQQIPVQDDNAPIEEGVDAATADSDAQLGMSLDGNDPGQQDC